MSQDPGEPPETSQSRRDLVLYGAVLAVLASLLPLYDPDLPMHLALGEWVVTHRAVPTTEPFAWTRQGDPYYAYSWLPQTIFYLVHASIGPFGLRLLQGVLMGGVFAATVLLGRGAGWKAGTVLLAAAGSVLVAGLATPSLRPQIILMIVLPLVWREVMRSRDRDEASFRSGIVLVGLSAVAANSHLFFPLLLAPVPLLLSKRTVNMRAAAMVTGAIVIGWLISPYGGMWPEVFATNFSGNALLTWPSPIAELQPGFLALVTHQKLLVAPVALLLVIPWVTDPAGMARDRPLAIAYWALGLIAFGYASRLVLVWWLLFLPFLGGGLNQLGGSTPPPAPRPAVRLFGYVGLGVLLLASVARTVADWPREGTIGMRTLATWSAQAAEEPAAWLEANTAPRAIGRLFTVFNYGSYLTWRLPRFSSSIDSRTIFPDSVAMPEALGPMLPVASFGPWASADAAIVPMNRPVAAVLDTATGWRRVLVSAPADAPDAAGLWIREAWWVENHRHDVRVLPGMRR